MPHNYDEFLKLAFSVVEEVNVPYTVNKEKKMNEKDFIMTSCRDTHSCI
jgi:hypothetical protein